MHSRMYIRIGPEGSTVYWGFNLIGTPIPDRDPEKNSTFTQFIQVSGIDKYIKNHQFFITSGLKLMRDYYMHENSFFTDLGVLTTPGIKYDG